MASRFPQRELKCHSGIAACTVGDRAAAAGEALRLPAELAAFHREHPGIRIALRQGSPREVADLVRRGAADLAVVALMAAPDGVDATPLAPEPLRLIAAPGTLDGTVAIGELRGMALILAERGTALREAVNAACEAAGFGPIPPFEVGDPVTARFLAAAGLGASVVPASWLEQPGPEVSIAPLDPEPRLQPYLLAPAGGLSPAGRLLREQLLR